MFSTNERKGGMISSRLFFFHDFVNDSRIPDSIQKGLIPELLLPDRFTRGRI
jgi:hypothetical protein